MLFGVADTRSDRYKLRENGKKTLSYAFYENMIARCYYYKASRYGSYGAIGVKVDEEWLSYDNFSAWFYDNYVEGFHLDKDIISEDGMLYSKYDCCFVPREINNLFVITPRTVNENLPSGVFKSTTGYYGRYKNKRKQFKSIKEAKSYVIDLKFENCKLLVNYYKNLLNNDVIERLLDKDFFSMTIHQLDNKREVKLIE